MDFKATCFVVGKVIYLNPVETVNKQDYNLWLVRAVTAPEKDVSEDEEQFYAFRGYSTYHGLTVDMPQAYSINYSNPMYA